MDTVSLEAFLARARSEEREFRAVVDGKPAQPLIFSAFANDGNPVGIEGFCDSSRAYIADERIDSAYWPAQHELVGLKNDYVMLGGLIRQEQNRTTRPTGPPKSRVTKIKERFAYLVKHM